MARPSASLLFVGIRGQVVALNRGSGEEVWRTKLKGYGFVQVMRDADFVYAATRGELFCLHPNSGSVVWHNELKGLGLDLASISSDAPLTTAGSDFAANASAVMRRRAAAAAAAS